MHRGIRNVNQRHNGYDHDQFHERVIKVVLDCNRTVVDERTVKVENIQEDLHGRDVLTFTCPACGQQHQSLRFG
jgi:hypothetical protein